MNWPDFLHHVIVSLLTGVALGVIVFWWR